MSIVVLQQVALVLSKENERCEVEGHTDDLTDQHGAIPVQLELSAARASGVVRVLIETVCRRSG